MHPLELWSSPDLTQWSTEATLSGMLGSPPHQAATPEWWCKEEVIIPAAAMGLKLVAMAGVMEASLTSKVETLEDQNIQVFAGHPRSSHPHLATVTLLHAEAGSPHLIVHLAEALQHELRPSLQVELLVQLPVRMLF